MNLNLNMAAIVRPGDTLIIAFENRVTEADFDRIRSTIKERLGIDVAVIEGASGLAVYRPEPEQPTEHA